MELMNEYDHSMERRWCIAILLEELAQGPYILSRPMLWPHQWRT